MEEVIKDESLEYKLQRLIELLPIFKIVSKYIFDDDINEIFLDCVEEDMIKNVDEIIVEIRIYLRELYKTCKNYIDTHYVSTISKMVEQQGMCICYENKDYRLIKFYDACFKYGVGYLFDEYQNTNFFSEIANYLRITIKDDKIFNADKEIMQGLIPEEIMCFSKENKLHKKVLNKIIQFNKK